MGWEQRGKRRYYYRSTRLNGRVKKEYIGHGLAAMQAAIMDATTQRDREHDRSQVRAFQDTVQPLRLLASELEHGERLLIQASMLSAGFRQHKGTWRKRRGTV